MVVIIDGGHREGLSYNAALVLKDILENGGETVRFFSLRDYALEFCCGNQPCQDSGVCVHTDMLTEEIFPSIVTSKVLVIFTPTYFNLPPAILKNFMDRCNFLLAINERKSLRFGAWVSGQTENDSLEQCYQSLATFAEICDYELLAEGRVLRVEQDVRQKELMATDKAAIQKLAEEIISLS